MYPVSNIILHISYSICHVAQLHLTCHGHFSVCITYRVFIYHISYIIDQISYVLYSAPCIIYHISESMMYEAGTGQAEGPCGRGKALQPRWSTERKLHCMSFDVAAGPAHTKKCRTYTKNVAPINHFRTYQSFWAFCLFVIQHISYIIHHISYIIYHTSYIITSYIHTSYIIRQISYTVDHI